MVGPSEGGFTSVKLDMGAREMNAPVLPSPCASWGWGETLGMRMLLLGSPEHP